MLNCPRRTIGWSSCPVIRSQRRICCSCFDSCRSNFLLNRRRKSKPGTIAKSRERSPPVVPTFGAVSQGFQYLGVTQPPQLVKSGYTQCSYEVIDETAGVHCWARIPRRRFLHLAASAAALPIVSRVASAQAYPARPVRLIVGFTPGGAFDITARLMGQWLSE